MRCKMSRTFIQALHPHTSWRYASSGSAVASCDWLDRKWLVPDLRSSPVHRALAAELRRLREHAGKSGDEVASALRWSASKVSRIETNKTGVKLRDLNQLLNLYGVEEDRRRQLAALASEPEPRGWWTAYADSIGADYAAYISLEDSAASMSCWSPELIHGLL